MGADLMRSIWKGAVSFGLVNVPVKVYSATQNHDIKFHQVHEADGGRIRYKRTCSECGKEVTFADIAKGYESADGRLVLLTDEDLKSLPLSSSREIDVVEFVGADEVDPLLLDKSYYLEPDAKALKPYVLLREALEQTDRMAVVKVALRQRESLAVLRVRGNVIVLQTMLWPDEIREPAFDLLDTKVELRSQEVAMAASLVDSLAAEFDPSGVRGRVRRRGADPGRDQTGGRRRTRAVHCDAATDDDAQVLDLLAALQRSVDDANGSRKGTGGPKSVTDAEGTAPAKQPAKKGNRQEGAGQEVDRDQAQAGSGERGSRSARRRRHRASARRPRRRRPRRPRAAAAREGLRPPTGEYALRSPPGRRGA
jgi:DNA end-binding protein Ku